MKRNFLLVDTYSAMDWHDWDRTFEYIENGTFEDFVKKELNRLQEKKQIKEFDIINNVFVATMGHSLSNIEAVLAGAKENAIYDLKEAISDALESGELEDERE